MSAVWCRLLGMEGMPENSGHGQSPNEISIIFSAIGPEENDESLQWKLFPDSETDRDTNSVSLLTFETDRRRWTKLMVA